MSSHTEGRWTTRAVLSTVLGTYGVSFFLPVTDAGTPQVMYGYQAFFWGLVSLIYLPMWLANPLLWFGCICYRDGERSAARKAGTIATLLAISEVWLWDDPPEIGYYVWIGSMVLLAIAGAVHKDPPIVAADGTAPNFGTDVRQH